MPSSNQPMSASFGRRSMNESQYRVPGFRWMPNKVRNHLIAMLGEFFGTFLFLFFAFSGTQIANEAKAASIAADGSALSSAPNAASLIYISLVFGFSLAVNAWTFFRISGGLFNPAVTVGMCLIGAIGPMRAILIFFAQLLGSTAAAAVVSVLFPGKLNVGTNLTPGTTVVQGLFIEMFLTIELVFTIFMLAAEKHKGTFLAPVGIGLSLFVAELTGVYFTGGGVNPARAFGPCVVLHSFPSYHWLYWIGPLLGAVISVIFYKLIKILEFETANPGQDFDEKEAEDFDPDERFARAADVTRPDYGGYRTNALPPPPPAKYDTAHSHSPAPRLELRLSGIDEWRSPREPSQSRAASIVQDDYFRNGGAGAWRANDRRRSRGSWRGY